MVVIRACSGRQIRRVPALAAHDPVRARGRAGRTRRTRRPSAHGRHALVVHDLVLEHMDMFEFGDLLLGLVGELVLQGLTLDRLGEQVKFATLDVLPQFMDLDGFALLGDFGLKVLRVDLAVGEDETFFETRKVALELGDLGLEGQVLE